MPTDGKDTILILGPPTGTAQGGGVRRVAELSKRLRASGFEVTTMARGGSDLDYFSVASALKDGARTLRLGRVYRKAAALLTVPDDQILDLPLILGSARHARPDLIIASAPPSSLLVSASALARRIGRPWIADLRDPWLEHPELPRHTPLHGLLQSMVARRTLKSASGILAATEAMAERLSTQLGGGVPVHAFFNGFDPVMFEGEVQGRDEITVGYYGSFYGPIDPEPLVAGVARAGVLLEHAGSDFDGALGRAVKRHGARFHSLGMLPEREAVRRMRSATVLALVLPLDPAWAYCRTQKLAQYLASGRPILAIVPPGEAAAVIEEAGAGIAVSSSDPVRIAEAISSLARRNAVRPDAEALSWDRQVDRVLEFLAGIGVLPAAGRA